MCALWAPQVHLDRKSRLFVNVEIEVARSRSLLCDVCHRHGAALGCYAKGCCKTYHYPCAKEAGCHVNHSLYIIYCPDHFLTDFLKESREKVEQVKIKGLKEEIFEKGRFQQPNERKRQLKSLTSRNIFKRYKSAKEVFNYYTMGKPTCQPVVIPDLSEKLGGLKKQLRILKELVVMPLLYPELHVKFRAGRAVLLYGPPGNGKTLLVKEIAKASGKSVSFLSRKGPDILSRYHGETEKNLVSVFQKAKEKCPAIIFFDEIDGLCPIRSFKQEQVHNSVVSTLLTLLDELVYEAKKVFVIGATSRVQMVDPALRRPGRFDREVYVGLPDEKTRREILNIHTRAWNNANSEELNNTLEDIAKRTSGKSGADLKGLCTEALLSAIRRVTLNKEPFSDKVRSEEYAKAISQVVVLMQDFDNHLKRKSQVDKYMHLKDKCTYMVDRFLSFNRDEMERSGILSSDLVGGRLLVDGDGEIGQSYACDHIVEKSNAREISVLFFPEAAAFKDANTFEEFVTKKMLSFCEAGRGILVIPKIEEYFAGPSRISSLLVSLLWDLPRSKPVLVLCYSHMEWTAKNIFCQDVDRNFLKLFAKNRFTIHER